MRLELFSFSLLMFSLNFASAFAAHARRKLGDHASEICSRDNLIYTLKKMERFDDAIQVCQHYIEITEKMTSKVRALCK